MAGGRYSLSEVLDNGFPLVRRQRWQPKPASLLLVLRKKPLYPSLREVRLLARCARVDCDRARGGDFAYGLCPAADIRADFCKSIGPRPSICGVVRNTLSPIRIPGADR
jgi:hypothetical protein